ncbi:MULTISPECIES: PKD domain-containing protein [Actinosynnema]|uniref:PKD domain-containing protein n=1 Tax=Actinosynnema TaxID=40566 RepID=UPI0020A31AA0|nr:PKD domain-containing protein [Actinosynnema pretiosum]MCP2094404.1 PKD domain-containing protein [Actinosynnema pretiosum]
MRSTALAAAALALLTTLTTGTAHADAPLPVNDSFANATPVTSLPFTEQADVRTATVEPGEAQGSCDAAPTRSIWYALTPAETASITLSDESRDYYHTLTVYTGSSLADLTEFAPCWWSYGRKRTFVLTEGTTYHVRVATSNDEYASASTVGFALAPPPFADFEVMTERPRANQPVSFYTLSWDQGGGEGTTVLWDFGDGTQTTEYRPEHVYTKPGLYRVTQTVTTTDGRTATVTKWLRVRR